MSTQPLAPQPTKSFDVQKTIVIAKGVEASAKSVLAILESSGVGGHLNEDQNVQLGFALFDMALNALKAYHDAHDIPISVDSIMALVPADFPLDAPVDGPVVSVTPVAPTHDVVANDVAAAKASADLEAKVEQHIADAPDSKVVEVGSVADEQPKTDAASPSSDVTQ